MNGVSCRRQASKRVGLRLTTDGLTSQWLNSKGSERGPGDKSVSRCSFHTGKSPHG
jgi:hypothetical protein